MAEIMALINLHYLKHIVVIARGTFLIYQTLTNLQKIKNNETKQVVLYY